MLVCELEFWISGLGKIEQNSGYYDFELKLTGNFSLKTLRGKQTILATSLAQINHP
jgi:hypothetical protein